MCNVCYLVLQGVVRHEIHCHLEMYCYKHVRPGEARSSTSFSSAQSAPGEIADEFGVLSERCDSSGRWRPWAGAWHPTACCGGNRAACAGGGCWCPGQTAGVAQPAAAGAVQSATGAVAAPPAKRLASHSLLRWGPCQVRQGLLLLSSGRQLVSHGLLQCGLYQAHLGWSLQPTGKRLAPHTLLPALRVYLVRPLTVPT